MKTNEIIPVPARNVTEKIQAIEYAVARAKLDPHLNDEKKARLEIDSGKAIVLLQIAECQVAAMRGEQPLADFVTRSNIPLNVKALKSAKP